MKKLPTVNNILHAALHICKDPFFKMLLMRAISRNGILGPHRTYSITRYDDEVYEKYFPNIITTDRDIREAANLKYGYCINNIDKKYAIYIVPTQFKVDTDTYRQGYYNYFDYLVKYRVVAADTDRYGYYRQGSGTILASYPALSKTLSTPLHRRVDTYKRIIPVPQAFIDQDLFGGTYTKRDGKPVVKSLNVIRFMENAKDDTTCTEDDTILDLCL